MHVECSSVLNFRGSNKKGVGSQKKILKVGVHNKVTFRASYNFIGKTGGRNKDGGGGGVFTV